MEICRVYLLDDGIYDAIWYLYDLIINGRTYKTPQGEMMLGQAFKVKVENGYAYRL